MALDFSDYDGLIASIADTLNRTDLEERIPGWIQLAEEEHKSDVRIREMLDRVELEIDGRTIELPTGFVELKRMRILTETGTRPYELEERTSGEMTKLWRSPSEGPGGDWLGGRFGRPAYLPRYFAIGGDIEFDCDPAAFDPADNPLADVEFYKAVTGLSADDPSNAILARAPAAYFYGALKHSAPFLLDDARVTLWGNAYQAAVGRVNMNDRKRGGPQASRVQGPTP